MFGYKFYKIEEIETLMIEKEVLKKDLLESNELIESQKRQIEELTEKVKEKEITISNLTKTKNVKKERTTTTEEKPVKKVRRKSVKKTTKKEE